MCMSPVAAVVGEERGFAARYGLDDWKFAVPVGILFGMPVIANEVSGDETTYSQCHHAI